MKNIIEDIRNENFTVREYIIYGLVAPLAFVAACVVAELITKNP